MLSDPGRARQVERALRQLQEHAPDEGLRRLAGRVLRGELTLRDVPGDPAFERAAGPAVARFVQADRELTDEQREALVAQGRELREEARLEAAREAQERQGSQDA